MKNVCLKLAVLSVFGVLSVQANAGEVTVPAAGFGSSAYTPCYNTGRDETPGPAGDGVGGAADDRKGNFGSYPIALANYPTTSTSANSTCYVTKPTSEAILPAGKTGFTALPAVTSPIPTATGAGGNIGTIVDRAWRNATTNTCIIGTRVTMVNADHDSGIAGTQLFEVNDIARGGFSGLGDIKAYYTIFTSPVTVSSPVYRVGRTFTSVQHRSKAFDTLVNKSLNGAGYLDLPTATGFNGPINGEITPITASAIASTTAATQDAVVNDNYVDFTFDAVFTDDDGSTNANSAFIYIEASCTADPTSQANAIRLRQTAQENTTPKEISMSGYAIGTP
ncbi:MAG: hypothetical protein V4552_02110 [Pseudomonadota bacterium]